MAPASVGVVAILFSLVPGWLYTQLRESLTPRRPMSPLQELLSALSVGLATTGVSVAVLALIPHTALPFLVDLNAWAAGGNAYLRQHVPEAIRTVVAIFVLAIAISLLLYLPQRVRLRAEFNTNRSVWVAALGSRPQGMVPWVGVALHEGDLVEGVLHSYSISERPADERDVALRRPIRHTPASKGAVPFDVDLDHVVFPGREIAYLTVVHVPEKKKTAGRIAGTNRGAPQ